MFTQFLARAVAAEAFEEVYVESRITLSVCGNSFGFSSV